MNLSNLKIVLINLDRSNARRQAMTSRLDELGLPFERISAIDGKQRWEELSGSVDIDAFERNVGRHVMPGEIGCYHSHLLAWRHLLASPQDVMLVLEDDVVFDSTFNSVVTAALAQKHNWDLLKLNKIRAKQPVHRLRFGAHRLCAYLGPFTGMGAYLISRGAVLRLLPKMLPITRPIDHLLDRVWELPVRHYGLEPFPSWVQDEGESTITGSRYAEVKKFRLIQRLPYYAGKFNTLIRRFVYVVARTDRKLDSNKYE